MIHLRPRIVANPAIHHGKPVIEGTRVPVHVVVGHVAAGTPISEVADEFGVTKDDIL